MKLIVNNTNNLFKLVVNPNNPLKLLIKPKEIIVLKINNKTAGQAINGLPSGGTTGQILAKASNADYNAEWVDNDLGTVTSVSVVSANGFDGTVVNPTTTPAITLKTTVTGMVKGDGTAISAATPDVDYATPAYVDAKIEDQIVDGVTDKAPSQNAVYDALQGKQDTITPQPLTKVDDTNVTLTLGGTPATALLEAVSLTLGWTGQLDISKGGTGQSTAIDAFDALSPLTTLGDTLYHDGANNVRLGGNTTTTQKFLAQTGDGANSDAPSWETIPLSGQYLYYLQDTASDVALYKKQIITPYGSKTTISNISVINGQLLAQWITDPNYPNLSFIPSGLVSVHINASRTSGAKNTKIYAEIWETDSLGVDISLIGTTSASVNLSGIEISVVLEFTLASPYTMASSASRVATKVIADVSGAGSAPDIDLYFGGTVDSYTAFPSIIISANNFVPYTGATQDVDLNAQSLTNSVIDADLNNISNIDNGEIKAGANIDVTKLASMTANRVVISDGSGFIAPSSISSITTLTYLDATSSIQTQLDNKVTKGGDADGTSLVVGTTDNNVLSLITNSNPTIYAQTDKKIALNHNSPQSTLHMKGDGTNGANAFIFFGDSFGGGTTPYVSIGENGGTDSDAMELFGQNGIYMRASTYGGTAFLTITSGSKIGLNNESPTAYLHLQACSSGSNNSSLKMPAGTLSTASDGALDYDGTNYYACVGTTRYEIARCLTGTAALNFPSTAAQSSSDLTITVTGAAVYDSVSLGHSSTPVSANSCYTAWVSGANTVTVRFNNYSTGTLNPVNSIFKVTVFKNI